MKITENRTVIISTMKGAIWGGSEELWFKLLKLGLKKNKKFEVVIFDNGPLNNKLQSISDSNSVELKRLGDQECIRPNLMVRILYKLLRKSISHTYLSRFENLINEDNNNVVLSLGDFYDLLNFSDLGDFCLNSNKKIFIVVQHFFEYGFLDQNKRVRIIEIINAAEKVCFVSKRNLETVERILVYQLKNACLIRNPFNLASTEYVEFPNDKQVLKLASVARLSVFAKGQDMLFQVLSNETWRNRKYILEIFGNGEHQEYLQELVEFYGLKENIKFKGHAKNIREIWEQNHILILTSRSEGTPLSLIEAMICGRPALVTDVGDCASLIKEDISGFVANCSSEKALTTALEKVWLKKDELQSLGLNARTEITNYIDYLPEQELFDLVYSK